MAPTSKDALGNQRYVEFNNLSKVDITTKLIFNRNLIRRPGRFYSPSREVISMQVA